MLYHILKKTKKTINSTTSRSSRLFLVTFFFVSLFVFGNTLAHANSKVEELREQIHDRGTEISEIEKEIEQYQVKIEETLKEKQTLKNQVNQFSATANKLKAEINLTGKQIISTNLAIKELDLEIVDKDNQIQNRKEYLAEIIRKMDEEDSQTLIEILLAHNSFSEFFDNIQQMEYIQEDINVNLSELKELKAKIEEYKIEKNNEKNNLEDYQSTLSDKKEIAEINKNRKNNLLTQTKNTEENYRKLLEEKEELKKEFLREIAELESELQFEIDPNSIPAVGTGVLRWPLDDPSPKSCWAEGVTAKACITQFFGNTKFATQNPQVYGGTGHNGIDLRASVGTPVKASLSGVVEATGNTDEIRGCYSYGKWVLIKHHNGLSTLYAHLSLIKVSKGSDITTGQVIGYSGVSGYATGPHLHFTVYATQGVRVVRFGDIKEKTNCANAYMPVANKDAYLNPLSFL
ncbi:murein hydrolase activator EnvC family protein [Patescibacteria group bacterium]